MKSTALIFWAMVGACGVLKAQDTPVPRTQDEAKETPSSVPSAEALQRDFDTALKSWSRDYAAAVRAKNNEEAARLRTTRPERAFAERFAAAAAKANKTEAAVPYLAWIVQRGPIEMATAAMTTLMRDHASSKGIRLAVARLGGLKQAIGLEQSRAWLDHVLDVNEDAEVRAQALFTRAGLYVGTRALTTSPELRMAAIQDLKAAEGILSELEGSATSLLRLVTSLRDEAERLEPGLAAPEIEGKDLDGVAFKLSDYRGKVVLLDFWGDW